MSNQPLLIVFEGIDNSGKTSISQRVSEMLKEDFVGVCMLHSRDFDKEEYKEFVGDPRNTWQWQKEPTFSTQEADRLNNPDVKMDENEREVLFLESRLRQQSVYSVRSTVLDRYLWTGMAYAKMFSPACYEFTTRLYTSCSIFKMPDLTIFVDTPVELCHEREPEVSVERLTGIRNAYLDTKKFVKGPVETITGEGSLEENAIKALKIIQKHFFGPDSDRLTIDLEFPCTPNKYMGIRTWSEGEKSNEQN